jgi:hypothetical protein
MNEGTYEYTKPTHSKNELICHSLFRIVHPRGIGFINSKLSSRSILDQLPTLKLTYRTSDYKKLEESKETNKESEILFVTGLKKVRKKEYREILTYKKENHIEKIIFLSENYPKLGHRIETEFYVFEDSNDGFFLEKFKKEKTKWTSKGKEHYFMNPKKLTDLFLMARKTSEKQDETQIWSEYKRLSIRYDNEFHKVIPEGITDYLKVKKQQNKKTSIVDFFSDPSMVRGLKEEGVVDEAVAVGASDSRTKEERKIDYKYNIQYISEPGSSGVWSGNTWRKIKEYIEKNPILSANNGFDLVVANPVRGWLIGRKPPFS